MREIVHTRAILKDFKRLKKRGYRRGKLEAVIDALRETGAAPESCRPHKLQGDWKDHWECHIAFDWLLIYKVDNDTLTLIRTGTHADLFE